MKTALRHFATLLALVALSATSVAGLGMQAADAQDTRASAMQGCAQSMAAAEESGTEVPHCPSAPIASAGPCGGPLALPAHARIQGGPDSAVAPILTGRHEVRDLLLVALFFRPPIV